jgi:wyosine [tRNA(Phe)-imidazoG37] synthetase (radical SAM superfamily)
MCIMINRSSLNPVADANPGAINGDGDVYVRTTQSLADEVAFGYPRDFLFNKFVYFVISARANGLSIGLNLNPSTRCNMNCRYCEVDRTSEPDHCQLDINRMTVELGEMLELAQGGWLRQWPRYASLPEELLKVRHVALSGNGEPTLAKNFLEAVRSVVHVRQLGRSFKIVLVTNSTGLDRPQAREALALFGPEDEVWAKLDGGTQDYISMVNGPSASLEKILGNILRVARQRPVVIQSLFPAINGEEPSANEIIEYSRRLKDLSEAGANIPLVQIYSATRPMARLGCSHLPLKSLSSIAKTVRRISGLRAEVF